MLMTAVTCAEKPGLILKPSDETFLIHFPILQMKYLENINKPSKWNMDFIRGSHPYAMWQGHVLESPSVLNKYKFFLIFLFAFINNTHLWNLFTRITEVNKSTFVIFVHKASIEHSTRFQKKFESYEIYSLTALIISIFVFFSNVECMVEHHFSKTISPSMHFVRHMEESILNHSGVGASFQYHYIIVYFKVVCILI